MLVALPMMVMLEQVTMNYDDVVLLLLHSHCKVFEDH